MKNLSLISFVGIDSFTPLNDVFSFKSKVPCEFSVLFSESKSLTNDNRYPSFDFCKNFLAAAKSANILASIHLCGSVIDKYLNHDYLVMDLCKDAYRVQLNLNINNYPNYTTLTDSIWSVIKKTGHNIILQQNKSKFDFMEYFLQNIAIPISILHDSSGGFGHEISEVHPPHDFHFTGYAGGLSAENVVKIVNLIELINPNNYPYYIDMESKIREDNCFSLEKCKKVVQNLEQM